VLLEAAPILEFVPRFSQASSVVNLCRPKYNYGTLAGLVPVVLIERVRRPTEAHQA